MIDFSETFDWLSFKLTGVSVILASITGGHIMTTLALFATLSTIVYNAIRIYKELKNKKP